MSRRDHRRAVLPGERESEVVHVVVDDVELLLPVEYRRQLDRRQGDRVADRTVKAKTSLRARREVGACNRVTAGEECDVMASPHQLLGERAHYAFGSAVKLLSLIHISEPTRLGMISYAVFCLKKKKK